MSLLRSSLAAMLAASLAVSNIVAAKIASFTLPLVGAVSAPAGFLGIGVAFLMSDLLGELYGKEAARDAVNGAIAALAVGWGIAYSAVLMPAAPFYQYAAEFNAIVGAGTTIVLASILTLLVSQNLDVSVFHKLKGVTDVKAVRNVGSTVVSQAVDTTLFIGLAFVALPMVLAGQPMPLAVAASLAVSQYVVKVLVALLDTPLFYAVSEVAQR